MKELQPAPEGNTNRQSPLAYNVTEIQTVDTVAAVFLGILSVLLLIALLRSQTRLRALTVQNVPDEREG